ncbi:sensor histidine kinase [Neorhodopirellula lusitana]|nr:HAMP domain-containing sensor histidine kinase [Neorhodopirellula lusitana]
MARGTYWNRLIKISLTNRVSAFFLVALGFILVGYSMVFYSVTRDHIDDQFAGEMRGVLNSLIAAAEVEETEVKWQPLEHSIEVGVQDEFGPVHWIVIGDHGLTVEQSRFIDRDFISLAKQSAQQVSQPSDVDEHPTVLMQSSGVWETMTQQVSAPQPVHLERELDEFDQLTVVVGRSSVPRDAIVFRLRLLVTLLPLLAWSLAALLGRWIVRKALQPVSAMAEQAQSIAGTDFDARLSHGDSGDEMTELGTAFNRLLCRQQAAFEQQRRFAGDAAHELRTPITVLLGQIDVMLRRPRSEAEYEATLRQMRHQTSGLQEIVETLLFLARSDVDSTLPTLRPVHLKRWLETQADSWRSQPRYSDLTLDSQLEDNTVVNATPALLGRVLDNLVFNAFKYSESNTTVMVRAYTTDRFAFIEVIDSGPGMEPEEIPQLFEPFFRSDEARRRGIAGSGLGLAIASRIATTLGGKIDCQSTVGQGSCFTLRIPLAK